MNILFVGEAGDSTCRYYRCELPAQGMRLIGHTVDVVSGFVELDNGKLTGFDPVRGLLPTPDVVVLRRIDEPVAVGDDLFDSGIIASCERAIKRARKAGQQVYVDIDDDPYHLPEWNPASKNLSDGDRATWAKDMRAANGVLCSSLPLAEVITEYAQAVTHVVRNGIDREAYDVGSLYEEHDPLRLGWMGTTDYRGVDLASIIMPLRDALEGKFGEVELWHLGARPDLPSIHTILGEKFPVQVIEKPWVPIQDFPQSLVNIDCAIIPMAPHRFNESRSTSMGLACMAAGVAFVASTTREYSALFAKGGGYVTETWEPAVRMLTEPEYRQTRDDQRSSGLALCGAVYSPFHTAAQYLNIFTKQGASV